MYIALLYSSRGKQAVIIHNVYIMKVMFYRQLQFSSSSGDQSSYLNSIKNGVGNMYSKSGTYSTTVTLFIVVRR